MNNQHHSTNGFSGSRLLFLCKLYIVGVSLVQKIPLKSTIPECYVSAWRLFGDFLSVEIFDLENVSASKQITISLKTFSPKKCKLDLQMKKDDIVAPLLMRTFKRSPEVLVTQQINLFFEPLSYS